ncbi:ABC transporter substrate-binding protein [Salinadaptatus halalkaliphilus]|uniref:ABC transporter substrate-binding protein n=1 Tax=Salinadaptatus halalkaliphilus TaxID=2419781 RepID=A0A4S3TGF8_9EURY|nr:ABC transporter substrate-binding protein [Salinadaptatus halalkaliphilus]THE63024.1 ABC transporter substrate-binding protein [Salinadaptatus halalkaliphilus]
MVREGLSRRDVLAATGTGAVVGLAGCSSDSGNGNGNGGGGGGDDVFRVGLVAFQSGPYSAFAPDIQDAFEMLIDDWNDMGGVQGMEVEGFNRDSEAAPETAIQRAQELIDSEGVDMLATFLSTDEDGGVMNVGGRNGVPTVTCATGARLLVDEQCNPYSFRAPTSTLTKAKAGAAGGVDLFGEEVFQLNPDYSWGHEIQEDWERTIEEAGGTVVDQGWAELGASDFSTHVGAIQDADPDWIQFGFAGSGAVAFMTEAQQTGIDIPQFHHVAYEPTILGAGSSVFDETRVYTPTEYTYDIDTEANQDFVDRFESETGRLPGLAAGQAYRHIEAALRAADGADGTGPDTLVSAIREWSGEVISGEYNMRSCDHQASYPMYIAEVDSADDDQIYWSVEETIPADEVLASCDEVTGRMECSVE